MFVITLLTHSSMMRVMMKIVCSHNETFSLKLIHSIKSWNCLSFFCLETEFILFTSPDKKAWVVPTQAQEIFPELHLIGWFRKWKCSFLFHLFCYLSVAMRPPAWRGEGYGVLNLCGVHPTFQKFNFSLF